MYKREMRVNFKSFAIWTGVMLALFIFVMLLYPSLVASGGMVNVDSMVQMFPEEVLRAFNMDISTLNTASGWIKSEGLTFFLLLGSLYSALLGSNILLKEENDKTIEFLAARPVRRSDIVSSRVVTGLVYVMLFDMVVAVGTMAGLYFQDDLNFKEMSMLLFTPLVVFWLFFALSLLIATFFRKTRKMTGISFAAVFGFYFIQMIGSLSEKLDIVRYFSPFTISDSRKIISDGTPGYIGLCIGVALIIVFISLTYYRYGRKELV